MTRSHFHFLAILAVFLSSCSNLPGPSQLLNNLTPSAILGTQSIATVTPSPNQQSLKDFVGLVVDMDGNPISGAHIETFNNTATSDKDGRFQFPSVGLPQWIKVTSPGFISRTRAASPGMPVLFRLTPDDGKTIVIHFAGDTMFGRRFYDSNGDNFTDDGLLPPQPTVDDHMKL
jgi:poly-gamma-glutamate synthesis protein (capsule biosynthesis protein)